MALTAFWLALNPLISPTYLSPGFKWETDRIFRESTAQRVHQSRVREPLLLVVAAFIYYNFEMQDFLYYPSVWFSGQNVKTTYPTLDNMRLIWDWTLMHVSFIWGFCQIPKKSWPCCLIFQAFRFRFLPLKQALIRAEGLAPHPQEVISRQLPWKSYFSRFANIVPSVFTRSGQNHPFNHGQ